MMHRLIRTRAPWSAAALVTAVAMMTACSDNDSPTAPDTTPPPVPVQVSPANGSLLTHFPRSTTLVWNPVTDESDPVTYRVEAQFCQSANPSQCSPIVAACAGVVTAISCTFNFTGGQPGRWRVKAVDNAGNESAFSDWWTFEYDS